MIEKVIVNGGQAVDVNDARLNRLQNIGQGSEQFLTKKNDGTFGYATTNDAAQILTAAQTMYFVRVWNLANSTPVAASWKGNLAFGQEMESYLGLGCYLVQNDHSRRKLAANNHYRFANGGTAKLDGSMGHYQWGWGIKFYILVKRYGTLLELGASLSYVPGYENYCIPVGSMSAAGWATMERSTSTLVSYINDTADYRGGNNDATKDGLFNTLLGKPASSMTTQAFLTAARKNGDGWLGSSMRHQAVANILFFLIFGTLKVDTAVNNTRDSNGLRQGGLGQGATNAGGWWNTSFNYFPVIPMSAGIDMGDACGNFSYDVKDGDDNVLQTMHCQNFFGLKNGLGGIMWRMMTDEIFVSNADGSQTHYFATNIMKVNDAYTYNIDGTLTGMRAGATTPTDTSARWRYISEVAFSCLECIPISCDGTDSTFFCDGYYNPIATSGSRLVLRSGPLLVGGQCGPSIVLGLSGGGGAYADYGSSLCEVTEEWSVDPVDESGQQLANAN